MKKIVLTEKQADKLVGNVVSEQIATENTYSQEVTCQFDYHGLKYHEQEIDWIEDTKINLTFSIHIEAREYGLKNVSVMNIRGPETVDVEIIYYPNGSEDSETANTAIKPDWSKVVAEKESDLGWIGIGPEIQMNLTSGEITVLVNEI